MQLNAENGMSSVLRAGIAAVMTVLPCAAWSAEVPDAARLLQEAGTRYERETLPILKQACNTCHATDDPQGDLDLERFATLAEIRKSPKVWQKVAEMIDNGEMPPKDAEPLSPEEKKTLRGWVDQYLTAESYANAGDPGPVVLRRLSNAEYTYTIRDLTGADLNPVREFPVDSAAGEGFTNTGNALVMSPSLLTKYFDAGKEIAGHAVLLPEGIRFSNSATRSDWTNETLAKIREIYRKYTDARGSDKVNLQGVIFDTNEGGRLPVDQYLLATITDRGGLADGSRTFEQVAKEKGLNAQYLKLLWGALNGRQPSLLLEGLRERWKSATADDVAALTAEIGQWQKALFRFNSVGHIGKLNGPTRWMESVTPIVTQQELRFKLPDPNDGDAVVVSLVTTDAGDGNEEDFAVWQQPRLVAPGRPDLLLRDVWEVTRELGSRRERILGETTKYLAAAAEAAAAQGQGDPAVLARKHGVEQDALRAWLGYLGISSSGNTEVQGHLTSELKKVGGYDFANGWGTNETPLVVTNSSDSHVRIPGNLKPHSVAVHPSPTLRIAAGWRSPVTATMSVEGVVQHAHPECGNGVAWTLELRRGGTRQRLATGVAHGATEVKVGPVENLAVQTGDLISLIIGARDGNHGCDLTALDFTVQTGEKSWNLAGQVSGDVLAGNPHADAFGNAGVWHFYTEPESGGNGGSVIPGGSLVAKWQTEGNADAKQQLAGEVQKLLTGPAVGEKGSPDGQLQRELVSLGGPLFSEMLKSRKEKSANAAPPPPVDPSEPVKKRGAEWGLNPELFGKHPNGGVVDAGSLCVQAPAVIEVRLPSDLAAGCELVTGGLLEAETGKNGSVQLQIVAGKPKEGSGLRPAETTTTQAAGQWTDDNRRTSFGTPILVREGSGRAEQIERAFEEFRQLFPAALCYTKIVPVDEVVTLTLFYREDDHLSRLMLDEVQKEELNRLWEELHFISQDALTLVDAFQQLMEYATQDADPKVFEPLREPINARAAAFRQALVDAEPQHVEAVIRFARQANRKPLTVAEEQELRGLYQQLRKEELPHEEAIRFVMARVLVSPGFLYRLEEASAGTSATAVSDWELATRLSYFLWSTTPDEELRSAASNGTLHQPEVLAAQGRRMLKDARVRRLATEFACQWIHVYDFNTLDEKSEKLFPEFTELRHDMYEETIQFFTDLFQRDGSVLETFDADHTFVNERLAKFYGIEGISGGEWQKVSGLKEKGRGGLLGFATTLAKQSGASRTSPILRGNWVSEVLLGEKLPRPPKNVPQLPDDEEATKNLTERQLIEKHSSDASCAHCHVRIDPLGFSLESFDAIGRFREKDHAGRPVDTLAKLRDGTEFRGIEGLRKYLTEVRREAIVHQFCKKLLGYALGRGVQLSDEPLITEMMENLKRNEYRFSAAVETILLSPQFRMIRGADTPFGDQETAEAE